MVDLWETITKLLTANHKILTESDIEKDINWLYERKKLSNPEIILFKSVKDYNKYVKKFNYDIPKFGLANEIEFYAYWSDNIATPDIRRYLQFLKKGVFHAIFNDHKALICMLPKKILLDNNNDFHSLKQPAILWHDESGKYYIHGRRFSKVLFDKVVKRKLSMQKVLAIKNIEQRYVTLRLYGIERLMKDLKPTLIHESNKGNKLYSVVLDDQLTANFLLYNCPSTGRQFTKFVDHNMHYTDADQAMAKSHHMTKEQYLSMEIEA